MAYLRGEQAATGGVLMHPDTLALLERMLIWLAENGEDATFERIKREIVRPRYTEGATSRF